MVANDVEGDVKVVGLLVVVADLLEGGLGIIVVGQDTLVMYSVNTSSNFNSGKRQNIILI